MDLCITPIPRCAVFNIKFTTTSKRSVIGALAARANNSARERERELARVSVFRFYNTSLQYLAASVLVNRVKPVWDF